MPEDNHNNIESKPGFPGQSKIFVAKTRSSGITFVPPKTYDMVRTLFDPTIKKTYLEIGIAIVLISNVVFAHICNLHMGRTKTRLFYLVQYIFWRLCYNLGIGITLHYQSHYESLTKFSKQHRLFDKKNTGLIASFLQAEVNSIVESPTKTGEDVYSYPDELNVWLVFRQFVDLILMQDFDTYMLFVWFSLPEDWSEVILSWRSVFGLMLVLFNVWVKIDAHRVVKDYAWYWGDFFFLQMNSELVFDGVFNLSPHPMYSIGYFGYYGFSLITGDYQVLLVSVLGHFLQFLFLKYVESPHIERIYGSGNHSGTPMQGNHAIDDLIAKEVYDYSRPLITTGFWVDNFDKLRFSDYFTFISVITLILWEVLYNPSDRVIFYLTFTTKLASSLLVGYILYMQSKEKWFTKLYMKNGYSQVFSYQQWQFIYNFTLVIPYTLLTILTLNKVIRILYTEENYTKIIFGLLLCALQVWCDTEIRSAISDFGWFYGDFFLSNYITSRKLTSQGIYRYLNNPEAILGVAGVWGSVLMTDFSWENMTLTVLWTVVNFVIVKYIESPHLEKIYGANQRISGVGKTLLSLKPFQHVSDIVDSVEQIVLSSILPSRGPSPLQDVTLRKSDSSLVTENETEWEKIVRNAIENVQARTLPNCKFEVELANSQHEGYTSILPGQITVYWKLPRDMYSPTDWVGLYNVMRTRNNKKYTKRDSMGHWSYTTASEGVVEVDTTKEGDFVSGKIIFDYTKLVFERGIYEFRYHSKDTHKVLMISSPFELKWPKLEVKDEESLRESLSEFLKAVHVVKNGKYFDESANKFFGIKALQSLIKSTIGVELSKDYIRKVKGDIDVISGRIWDIKNTLDKLL